MKLVAVTLLKIRKEGLRPDEVRTPHNNEESVPRALVPVTGGDPVPPAEVYRGKLAVQLPELYQAAKLFELLPQGPNELWQADVTYIHIPGNGWWYAVTVIDYFSRYLLAIHLSSSFDAASLIVGVEKAKAEAERLHGPLARRRERRAWGGE